MLWVKIKRFISKDPKSFTTEFGLRVVGKLG